VRPIYLGELELVCDHRESSQFNQLCTMICAPSAEDWEQEEAEWGKGSDLVESEVVPLLEAFKVRTITKGNYAKYHLARRWQKVIHKRMRKHPSAQLIGSPCDAEILGRTVLDTEKWSWGGPHKGFFVSGDYESATDLLNPWLSRLAQAYIGRALGIPFEHQVILDQCLTKHSLEYKDGTQLQQQWGQLMGSPTSFPVLCLINLAATRTSYEIELGRPFKLADLPMVVNGDDILFRCVNQHHYQIWKEITGKCGLKFSLGKNYTSRRYLVINSELYKVTRSGQVLKSSQLNVRLIYGGSRSSVDGIDLRPSDYKESLRSLSWSTAEHGPACLQYRIDKMGLPENKRPDAPEWESFLNEAKVKKWREGRKMRLEGMTRFYQTVPQRAQCLLKQLKGDYTTVDDGLRVATLARYASIQIQRFESFRKEFLRKGNSKMPTISYYLPQIYGGLGLLPHPVYQYSPLDSAIVQVLSEDLELAQRFQNAISMRLVRGDALRMISSETSRVSKRLGLEPKLVPIDEWDEILERHGDQAPVTGTLSRAHADQCFHAEQDDYQLSLESKIETCSSGWSVIRSVHRLARMRLNRKGNKGECPAGIDLNRSEVAEKRLVFNTRIFTPVPQMP